jgi:hypothetical protein
MASRFSTDLPDLFNPDADDYPIFGLPAYEGTGTGFIECT